MDRKQHYYNKYKSKASEYLDDRIKLNELLEKARKKIDEGRYQLKDGYETVLVFYRLMRAYVRGEYRDIPPQKLILIIGAFIYLVSPFDAIFDFLPGGLIDDGAIFIWLLSSLKAEMDQFREWENQREVENSNKNSV